MPEAQRIIATERDDGQRLDNCLFRLYKSLPKSLIYRLLRKGAIRVNQKKILPEYRLASGDEIWIPALDFEEKKDEPLMLKAWQSEWLATAVIRETEDWVVVNKPAGLSVHAGSDTNMGVIEIVRAGRHDLKFVELAHRLDRETSGCLLIAKKPAALKVFHQMLRERESIKKTYYLLVKGTWPRRLNRVDTPIEGKDSLTTFQVLQHHEGTTKLSAILHTGRQHQIRIHCQKTGFPIVGDQKYGDFAFNREFAKKSGDKRMFLHAARLDFIWKNENYSCLAPCAFLS